MVIKHLAFYPPLNSQKILINVRCKPTNQADHVLSSAPASLPSIVAQCRYQVLLRQLPLHYPRTTASDEIRDPLQYTIMPSSCFHTLFGKEVCLSAALMSWNAVHDLTEMWRRSQPLFSITFLWSGAVCGVLTFHDTHKPMAEPHLNYLLAAVVV